MSRAPNILRRGDAEIIPKDTGIYRLFGNASYFNAAILEKRLNEIVKISAPGGANVKDWNETPLTVAQLWERYYTNDPGILRRYLNEFKKAANEESPEKISGKPKTPPNADISGPKQPKIEEIGKAAPSGGFAGEEIIPKNTEIYSLFANRTYFNTTTLERGLNEILKIFLPEEANGSRVCGWDGTPLTSAQLWEKYFANDPGILEEYLRALQKEANGEKPPEIYPESGKDVNGHIFKPKAGTIEEIEKEVLVTDG